MGYFRKKLTTALELVNLRDIVLLPGWSEIELKDVEVSSKLSSNIDLAAPFVSSPMDSVTGPELAIAIAEMGGIGILHRNCSVEEQLEMVQHVKSKKVNQQKFPDAITDDSGWLRVGIAVGPHDISRVKKLANSVDVIVIDVAHFHTRNCFDGARKILEASPVDVIVGNIGTFNAAEDVISQLDGVAGLRCGIGSGSTSTILEQMSVNVPTLFAVASAADATRTLGVNIPIIADGGIQNPGDVVLMLAAGAWSVMLGSVLAATEESLSPIERVKGKRYKHHWGISSERAKERYFVKDWSPQKGKSPSMGLELRIPLKGSAKMVIEEFLGALHTACVYIGASKIDEIWERARFGRVTRIE